MVPARAAAVALLRWAPMTLRLIALFKLLKGLLLVAVGIAALKLVHEDVATVITAWVERFGIGAQHRLIDTLLTRLSSIDSRTLASIGTGAFVYAALLLTEGVGLWMKRRWAEYLTVVITASLIPLEIHEIVKHLTALRVGALVVNVAIVVYLVVRLRTDRDRPRSTPRRRRPRRSRPR
jgi:uncharacterized membrane protein (DUF2068 family)